MDRAGAPRYPPPVISSTTPADVAAVADHYDDLDPFYREVWGEHVHHGLWLDGRETPEIAVRRLIARVAERAGIRAGTRVCDVGCGYGATARLLAREIGADVVGVTVSPVQSAVAASAAGPDDRVRIVLGDWLRNDLPAGAFDAAVAIESTEHMEDKAGCFAEIRRVLRREGRLVVCAWLAAERPRPSHARALLEPICREARLPAMGSESDYRELLAGARLTVDSFEDLTTRVARTWTICIRRAARRVLVDPVARRYVLGRRGRNRAFARTLIRIRIAYAVGAMRYGLFAATAR